MRTSQFALVGCGLIFTTSSYSPAQGAMYAPLALTFVVLQATFCARLRLTFVVRAPVLQVTTNLPTISESLSRYHTGAIIGGAVGGGVVGLLTIGIIAFLLRRRQRQRSESVGSSWSFVFESSY